MNQHPDDSKKVSRPRPINFNSLNQKRAQEIFEDKDYTPKIDHFRLTKILQLNKLPSIESPARQSRLNHPFSVERFHETKTREKRDLKIQNNTNILFRKETSRINYSPIEIKVDDSEEFLSVRGEPRAINNNVKKVFTFLLQKSRDNIQRPEPVLYQKKVDINLHIVNKVITDLDLVEPAKKEIIEELGLNQYLNSFNNNNIININMNDKIEINPTNIFQSNRSKKIEKLKKKTPQNFDFMIGKTKYRRNTSKMCSCNTKNINEDQFLLSSAYDQKLTEVKFFWQGANACLPFAFKKRVINYYENTDDFDSYEILDFSRKTIQGEEIM